MFKKTYVAVYNGNPMKGCWLRFRQMVHHLAQEGHHLYIVMPFPLEGIAHENIYPVVLEHKNTGFWGLRKIGWALKAAQLARAIGRQLGTVDYIAFDTHNGLPFFGNRQPFQRKTLFVRGNTFFQAKYNEEPIYGWFMRAIDGKVRRQSDVVVYNHRQAYEHERLQEKCKQLPVFLVENNSEVPPRCRLPQQKPLAPFTIGYCGQLSPRKNVQMLVQAMQHLPSHFKLIVQGNWQAYDWSRQAQSQGLCNVQFLNWGNNIASFYDRIDLFVLPSLYDDFSNAALDAIAHGLPVLLSNTGGSPHMVRQEPMLLFDLRQGVEDLVKKTMAIHDNYAWACHKVGQLSPHYSFDWAARMSGILHSHAESEQRRTLADRHIKRPHHQTSLALQTNSNPTSGKL